MTKQYEPDQERFTPTFVKPAGLTRDDRFYKSRGRTPDNTTKIVERVKRMRGQRDGQTNKQMQVSTQASGRNYICSVAEKISGYRN